jgi:coenzyme F420-reducing hydrogenase delta subunit
MENKEQVINPKILILATLSGGYRGADAAGQAHLEYPPNTYILPVMSAAMFPPKFYLRAFEQGIDAILVMYSGTDSPYKDVPERTAINIKETYTLMKERGLDIRRLRLVAICTVCVKPFLKEVNEMTELLEEIGLIPAHLPPASVAQAQAA